ncbi:hypothetical protein FRC03_004083 [Tulasnella sp. 419]|nr:hypothetical protein FRC03_004083 [Tulasnella sp. 419]
MHVPSFLQIEDSPRPGDPYSATYVHTVTGLPARARVLWWPCSSPHVNPELVVLFIPGNPGCIDFYIEYLSVLHAGLSPRVAIFGKAHLGHVLGKHNTVPHFELTSLGAQVISTLCLRKSLHDEYPSAKIVVIGHSVGAWIATRVLEEPQIPPVVTLLLFPTLSNIAQTPNGVKLAWLFWPSTALMLSYLAFLIMFIPKAVFKLLFEDWPENQLLILQRFCRSPFSIAASLRMAREEMRTIIDLDRTLLQKHRSCIYLYYALTDDWVGLERALVIDVLGESSQIHVASLPHAFCINADHSRKVAQKSIEWLLTIG